MLAAARSRHEVHVTVNDIEQGAVDAAKLNAKEAGVLYFGQSKSQMKRLS